MLGCKRQLLDRATRCYVPRFLHLPNYFGSALNGRSRPFYVFVSNPTEKMDNSCTVTTGTTQQQQQFHAAIFFTGAFCAFDTAPTTLGSFLAALSAISLPL